MMKAIGLRSADTRDLTPLTLPVPDISDTEVLVKIGAIGVGSQDRWYRPSNAQFPYATGTEASGEIVQTGALVDGYTIGSRVMILGGMQPKGGTWAELAAVSIESLINMPPELGFDEAAALPVAGMAALQGVNATKLNRGDTLFIAGASGAIGTLAIQIAAARGYRVAASASSRNHAYLLSLGAEIAVAYTDPAWTDQMKQWVAGGVDAVLAIQPGTGQQSQVFVKDGGRIVTVSGDQFVGERNIQVEQMQHVPETRTEFATLAADVASGKMRVVIDQRFPFERGVEALERTEARHARGKTVLTLDD